MCLSTCLHFEMAFYNEHPYTVLLHTFSTSLSKDADFHFSTGMWNGEFGEEKNQRDQGCTQIHKTPKVLDSYTARLSEECDAVRWRNVFWLTGTRCSRGMSSCRHIVPTAQTRVYKFQVTPELVLLHPFSSRLVYPWKFTSRHTEHVVLRHGWHDTAESQVDELMGGRE